MVRAFAAVGTGQWYGMKTVSGRMASVTSAGKTSLPRRVTTRTGSPLRKPCEGCTSTQGRGVCSTRAPRRRVWLPERKCATVRPVVRERGYSSV